MSLIDCILAFIYIYFFVRGLIAVENDDKQAVIISICVLFGFGFGSIIGLSISEYFFGSDSDL